MTFIGGGEFRSMAAPGAARGRARWVVLGLVALFVLSAFVGGGMSGGLSALGIAVLAVGAWALLRGKAAGFGIASRRAAAGVAAAGFVVTGIGGSLAPAAEVEPLPDQVAVATPTTATPTTSRPTTTRPALAATTSATTTTTPPLPPAPVMSMTCPDAAAGAAPVFGQQISATGPYQVTIDYGDGEVYTNNDQNLGAIFTHRYPSAGTFVVQAVLTDVAGQTATASCSYTWTAPVPAPAPAPAPVVGSTGGGSGSGSSSGGSVYYQNCTEVKAAGAAPIYPGDPGWQDKFDRDNDGVGCES